MENHPSQKQKQNSLNLNVVRWTMVHNNGFEPDIKNVATHSSPVSNRQLATTISWKWQNESRSITPSCISQAQKQFSLSLCMECRKSILYWHLTALKTALTRWHGSIMSIRLVNKQIFHCNVTFDFFWHLHSRCQEQGLNHWPWDNEVS